MTHRWLTFGLLVASLALGGLLSSPALAAKRTTKFYQGRFDHYSKAIADLKEADATDVAGQDIELIRTWISQAQAYLASDKLENIDPLLLRMAAQVEYVRAKVERVKAEKIAAEVEKSAKEAEQAAVEVAQATEAAEQKITELEAQGL